MTFHIIPGMGFLVVYLCACPSAGKTTLLDILSGRRYGYGVSGDIRFNGHAVRPARMKALCGYVMQVCLHKRLCISAPKTVIF